MKKVFESKFLITYYDASKKFVLIELTEDSENITDEEYKEACIKSFEARSNAGEVHYMLFDVVNFKMTISPDLQTWVNDNLTVASAKLGVKKIAYLMPEDIFSQESLEQTVDSFKGNTMELKFFNSQKGANNWLFEA